MNEVVSEKLTPMMEQYFAIKQENKGYLLFYRMGDFYEMFFEDAVNASNALDIALTKRGKNQGKDIPMCGVPVHSHEAYLAKLIRKGFRVAICEQTEDPEEARRQRGASALVNREVTRLITPGTLTEDNLLDAKESNYLAALTETSDGLGLAFVDMSTGDFGVQSLPKRNALTLSAGLSRLDPKEVIISDKLIQMPEFFDLFHEYKKVLNPLPHVRFSVENGQGRLLKLFQVATLDAFGAFNTCEIASAGALVDYIELTQKGKMPRLNPLKKHIEGTYLEIDSATRRNLELFHSLSGEKNGGLFHALDRTKTGAGARLLARYLATPRTDVQVINDRLDRVSFFKENPLIRATIQDRLAMCSDMERALSRLSLGRGGPRDLANIRDTLACIPDMKKEINSGMQGYPLSIKAVIKNMLESEELVEKLVRALDENLPLLARDGGFIAFGYCRALDDLKTLKQESHKIIAQLQEKYATLSGISSLKIAHNNILGYYIEVTAKNADKMTQEARSGQSIFLHRQTMVNAVRFITVELSELDSKLKGIGEKTVKLELDLFAELVNETMQKADEIAQTAQALAILDVACSMAQIAEEFKYVRPNVDHSLSFEIKQGRHVVVEQSLQKKSIPFVANDCGLNNGRLWLMTGPNMAGKSTFLRQNALIALMAQAGFFVPAASAHIGLIDKLFSRVGASDDLAKGRSTFMVEMVETAAILTQSTHRSFVILDEIGRGTSTFDGLSIAWAVVEHLHEKNQSRALFATHYHELTALSERLKSLALYTMKIKEWKENVIFLHEVIKGSANRSYGIHVGKLAGLPDTVITRAKQVLVELEKKGSYKVNFMNDLPLFAIQAVEPSTEISALQEKLDSISPDDLSPKQALAFLYELKSLAKRHDA